MLKVNLLPKENLDKQPLGKFLKWTLSYGRYIIISVELVVFLVFFSRFIYDQQLADINERVEQKQAIVNAAGEFENQIRSIHSRIEEVRNLDENRTVYLDTIQQLKLVTPVDVTFNSIDFSKEIVSLSGESLTNESFAKLLTALKSDESLSELSIQTLGKKEASTSKDEVETPILFTISATLAKYPTPTPIESVPVTEEEKYEPN